MTKKEELKNSIKYYIFRKGKDGFLYPHQNGLPLYGTIETLEKNLDDVKFVIARNFIENQGEYINKSKIETQEEFKEKYTILFEINTK